MKAFFFRLEKVLRYRGHMEKRAQRELYSAKDEYERTEEAIKQLLWRRQGLLERCRELSLKGIDVPRYRIYRSFLDKVDSDLAAASDRLHEAGQKVKAKARALREETIRKKTLKTLKQRQQERHIRWMERESQKAIDELVIIRREGRL